MKIISLICLIAALAVTNASGASWDQLPIFYDFGRVDPKTVKEEFDTLHPWKHSMPLPSSFEEAGLTLPVSLVAASYYFDGSSRLYLFRGAKGSFLVFCTDPMIYAGKDRKVEKVTAPRLFLGTFHFTHEPRTVVPEKSDTEHFLIAALAAESKHLSPEK